MFSTAGLLLLIFLISPLLRTVDNSKTLKTSGHLLVAHYSNTGIPGAAELVDVSNRSHKIFKSELGNSKYEEKTQRRYTRVKRNVFHFDEQYPVSKQKAEKKIALPKSATVIRAVNEVFKENAKKPVFLKQSYKTKTSLILKSTVTKRRIKINKRSTAKNKILPNSSIKGLFTIDKIDSKSNLKKIGMKKIFKRAVISLTDAESSKTENCLNSSPLNSSCQDETLNHVPDSTSNYSLNNTGSDKFHKPIKDMPQTFHKQPYTAQKKKYLTASESNVGLRVLRTNNVSSLLLQKRRTGIMGITGGGNSSGILNNNTDAVQFVESNAQSAERLAVSSNTPDTLDAGSITGIALGSVVFLSLLGAMGFIIYKRRNLNKPQTLSDKSSNPDSSVYIEESSDDSEEMYSLDNDSFLNSLEAMTIQNYWTENVKHTKL